MADLPMTQARKVFGSLVRRAASSGERTTITDHGQPAAVLVNPQELADLEEALAMAEYRVSQTERADQNGAGIESSTPISQAEVRARLGLTRFSQG